MFHAGLCSAGLFIQVNYLNGLCNFNVLQYLYNATVYATVYPKARSRHHLLLTGELGQMWRTWEVSKNPGDGFIICNILNTLPGIAQERLGIAVVKYTDISISVREGAGVCMSVIGQARRRHTWLLSGVRQCAANNCHTRWSCQLSNSPPLLPAVRLYVLLSSVGAMWSLTKHTFWDQHWLGP